MVTAYGPPLGAPEIAGFNVKVAFGRLELTLIVPVWAGADGVPETEISVLVESTETGVAGGYAGAKVVPSKSPFRVTPVPVVTVAGEAKHHVPAIAGGLAA